MGNGPFCIFEPPFGGLEAAYDVHLIIIIIIIINEFHRDASLTKTLGPLSLIGKRVVKFLLVVIIIFARFYRGGATSEYRLKISDFASTGSV